MLVSSLCTLPHESNWQCWAFVHSRNKCHQAKLNLVGGSGNTQLKLWHSLSLWSVEQRPLTPRVDILLFPCECVCLVAMSRRRQRLLAFLLCGHKCKAILRGSMLLIPQHFPVFSGSVAVDLYFGEAGSSLCSFLLSICIGKNTPAVSQSTCSVLQHFPCYNSVLN